MPPFRHRHSNFGVTDVGDGWSRIGSNDGAVECTAETGAVVITDKGGQREYDGSMPSISQDQNALVNRGFRRLNVIENHNAPRRSIP